MLIKNYAYIDSNDELELPYLRLTTNGLGRWYVESATSISADEDGWNDVIPVPEELEGLYLLASEMVKRLRRMGYKNIPNNLLAEC